MKKSKQQAFEEKQQFKKHFILKGYSEDFVHYLQRNLKKGGGIDGQRPGRVALPVKNKKLAQLQETKALEEQLMRIDFPNPKGNPSVWVANFEKFKSVMLPLLVSRDKALAINGGEDMCSYNCMREDGDEWVLGYRFVDNSRFQLQNCAHFSYHV